MSDFRSLRGIPGAVERHARAVPEKIAIAGESDSLTYLSLWSRVETLATVLARVIAPGDRVILQLPPSPGFAVAYLAVQLAGGVAVPMNTAATDEETRHVATDSGAKLRIDQAMLDDLATRRASGGFPGVRDDDDRSTILYTSGTTNKPKGVVHTHRSILHNLAGIRTAWRWTADDHLVITMPMYHTHGLLVGMTNALVAGATITALPRFEAEAVLDTIAQRRATMFFGVPTMYAKLVTLDDPRKRWNLDSVRLWVSGSAALPVEVFDQFRSRFGSTLLERYGMTETGMNLTNPYQGERIPGTVGYPFPGIEVRCVDSALLHEQPAQLADVPDDEPGEIIVRGSNLFNEYLNNPKATADAFADGWFLTGDIATRDASARFRIVGRASTDIIKSRGYKLGALEIEDVIARHPSVMEAAVIGVDHAEWGEAVLAVVAPKPGQSVTTDAIKQHCRQLLAGYKCPLHVVVVDEIPKTGPGKFKKRELIASYRAAFLEPAAS